MSPRVFRSVGLGIVIMMAVTLGIAAWFSVAMAIAARNESSTSATHPQSSLRPRLHTGSPIACVVVPSAQVVVLPRPTSRPVLIGVGVVFPVRDESNAARLQAYAAGLEKISPARA